LAVCTFVSTSTDVAPGTIASYAWAFGDGGTAAVQNPSHTYSVTGRTDFTVTLTVTDNEGATAVATRTITVDPTPSLNNPPSAGFTNACTLAVCTFVSTSTDVAPGTIASYAWAFGDGGTSDQASPSHTYTVSAATEFTVTLTVTDNEGASDVETQTITVTPAVPVSPPSAGFTNACTVTVCTFVSTSTDVAPGTIASYAWTFGDGGTSDQASPSHTYSVTARTEFTVTLTVTDNQGATDVETKLIAVDPLPPTNPPPSARFVFSCVGLVCTFVNTS